MENATKALVIAGAVLITILLISVGIMVFNAANDPINQSKNSSEQQAIQMFNEPIMANLGEGISAQQVKTLFSTIQASNARNEDHKIEIQGVDSISKINSKHRYDTSETYTDGYITAVTVTDLGAGNSGSSTGN